MPRSQYLDAFIIGALLQAPEVDRLPDADRRVLADLVAFARASIRLDANERAAVVAEVRSRAVVLLPAESHPFFVEDTAQVPTTSTLGAVEAVERLFQEGAEIVAENQRSAFTDATVAARFVARLPPEDRTRVVGILRRGHRLCDLAEGIQTGRVVGDENGAFFVD